MKKLFIVLLCALMVNALEIKAERVIYPPRKCEYEGQLCTRWDGRTGWCRTSYDIKGFPSIYCETMETDSFGFPDRGYFWPQERC